MPWCERCDRFLNPNTVQADGTCPACGRPVDASRLAERLPADLDPQGPESPSEDEMREGDEEFRAPWHFWVMIVAAVIYLGWRLVEGIWWAIGRLL